jgi:hypothetical protein
LSLATPHRFINVAIPSDRSRTHEQYSEPAEDPSSELGLVSEALQQSGIGFRLIDPRPTEPLFVKLSDALVPFNKSFWEACNNRSFFMTKEGYMGFGPPNLKAEDLVFVQLGGRVPFVNSGACMSF